MNLFKYSFVRWLVAILWQLAKILGILFIAGAIIFVALLFIYLVYKFIQIVPKT